MKPIHLRETRTSAGAQTYHYRAYTDDGQHDVGWAIVTVNDTLGILHICSDWGNFTHYWGVSHLGAASLTHFLAGGSVDYIVGKLRAGDGRQFSAEKTSERLIEDLIERRRDDIQRHGRHPEIEYDGKVYGSKRYYLTHEKLEEFREQLTSPDMDLGDNEAACALYMERLPADIHNFLSDMWERAATEETWESKHLRGFIVPAIVESCRREVERRFHALGVVEQLLYAALEGAQAKEYRHSLPVCPCNAKCNTACRGPSTFAIGVRCGYWGSLCGGDRAGDPYGSHTKGQP